MNTSGVSLWKGSSVTGLYLVQEPDQPVADLQNTMYKRYMTTGILVKNKFNINLCIYISEMEKSVLVWLYGTGAVDSNLSGSLYLFKMRN